MKRKFLLLFLMCITLMGGVKFNTLEAQDVTIGSTGSTTSNQNLPFRLRANTSAANYSSISQQIYTYDEIYEANNNKEPNEYISSLTFYSTRTSVSSDKEITIYMKNTDNNTVTAWDKDFSEANIVYSGNAKIDDDGKMTFILDKQFKHNKKNIIIFVDANRGSVSSSFSETSFRTKSASTKSAYKGTSSTTSNYGLDGTWPSISTLTVKNVITFTFSSGGTTPVLPTEVTNLSPNDKSIYGTSPQQQLEWTFGDNTTSYKVLVGKGMQDDAIVDIVHETEILTKDKDSNKGSYTAEDLEPSTTYYWQVISINENGETAGDIWYFTTIASTDEKPAKVTKKSPVNGTSLKTKDVVLQWQYNDENHTGYKIYLGTSEGNMELLTSGSILDNNIPEYTPSNLEGEKTYYWRVDVYNSSYTTEDTDIWSFTTQSVGSIKGIVKDGDILVNGATVNIKDSEGNVIATTTTDAAGIFKFTDIVIGNYNLVIEKDNIEAYTIGTAIEADKEADLGNIYLPSLIVDDNSWNITNATLSTDNELIVKAKAVLSGNAVVGTLTIEAGKSVTINKGGVLTVTGEINNNGDIIIEDGGQLLQKNENIQATFNMGINRPNEWKTNNKTGWQFISSPFVDAKVASFVPSEGEYDLYKYNGTQEYEWINQQKQSSGQGIVQIGEGEYYSNKDDKQSPICDFSKYSASQTIYTADEIDVEEGTIRAIAYNLQTAYNHTRNISVYLKNTDRTEAFSAWEPLTEDLCVYSGEYTFATTGWNVINFQNEFAYTGGNLLVVVVDNTGSYTEDGYVDYFCQYSTGALQSVEDIRSIHKGVGTAIDPLNITIGKAYLNTNIAGSNYCLAPQIQLDFSTEDTFKDEFVQGRGYLASYENEGIAKLTGNLYNKDKFAFNVSYNADKEFANFHLLGNPFPFNMDLSKITAEGLVDGYAVVNNEGGYDYLTSGTINVGDGFFVKANDENPSLSYDHSYVAPVLRGREKANSINVIASGKAGKDNVVVNFAGQAEGFNKLQNFNDAIATVYVTENGKNYGIANVDENATEVELSFVASQMGNYSISLDVNGEFETVTLVDRFTGIETNMLLEDEYTFTATSNDNVNRFVIRLANGQEPTANSQFVYQSGEELILSIEGSVQIVDMLGRVVYYNEHANGNNRINVAEFNDAAYVVRVVNEEGVKTQKVVIY